MKNLSDIKYRIKGISQTRQITSAMETVSIAKMRRAMQKFNNNMLYFNKVRATIRDIIGHSGGITHRYWQKRTGGRAVYVIIAGDKGLAGGYNNNVLNYALQRMEQAGHKERYVFTIGNIAREFFERKNISVDIEFIHMTHNPALKDAEEIADTLVSLYEQDLMDEAYVVYTALENSSTMRPDTVALLPLISACIAEPDRNIEKTGGNFNELYYDPGPEEVLEILVPQYLTGIIYSCLIQSVASEHSSRVLAMSSATKNADEILGHLNIVYNRARQEAITNEMIEIMTGANSVRG